MLKKRSNHIDYARIESLCLLGSYQRRLPVNLSRMIENAYDWAHLPYVHAGNFNEINLVSEGRWGWRAEVTLANKSPQQLQLLVDKPRGYWATTVLSGAGKGFEIHTQANDVIDGQIDIHVNFYMPRTYAFFFWGLNLIRKVSPFSVYEYLSSKLGIKGVSDRQHPRVSVLSQLQAQYSVLYDEDLALMTGRQAALDRRKKQTSPTAETEFVLGDAEQLKSHLPFVFKKGQERYGLNFWRDRWVVYGIDCPHLLGPLEHSKINQKGQIQCPWHGYKFDIISGENCTNSGRWLKTAKQVFVRDGKVICNFT